MALKALMLRKKIDDKKAALIALREKDADFNTREAELETAIAEANTDEEKQTVEESVTAFETDKQTHETAKTDLEREIGELENELAEEERKQNRAPANPEKGNNNRKEVTTMDTREFFGMNHQERDVFMARQDVKDWLQGIRALAKQERAVTGANLVIPDIVLPLIYSATEQYSKLLQYVDVQDIPGTARMVIMGDIPEGVWTEQCGKINEGGITFTQVELDGFKVACFIPVCNAILEDSDIALATEIIRALGNGLGYAVDKSIPYGTGVKMPTGFAGSIPAASKINASGKTGVDLFKLIVKNAAKMKHATGNKVWIMNESTHAALLAEALTFNAAGALVAGANNTMPVIGGDIVELDFVPDNEILGGYGKRYKLARRHGTTVTQSTEARFLEDETVFKATARYDGKPVFADAFMAIGLAGAPTCAVDASHPFVTDTANAEQSGG